jgi:predicted protein tyrosine phosphatase
MAIVAVRAVSYEVMQDFLRGNPLNPCAVAAARHGKVWIISVTSAAPPWDGLEGAPAGELPPLVEDAVDRIALVFDDIEPHVDRATGVELGRDEGFVYFDEVMAEKVCAFIRRAHEEDAARADLLLVNCHAGVSRSGAIADFARAVVEVDYEEFRRSNPQIVPNVLVRRLLFRAWDPLGLEPPMSER